jgi:hypothetical protein
VLAGGAKASDYASLLVAAARCGTGHAHPSLVAAVVTTPAELIARMTYMLEVRRRCRRLPLGPRFGLPALALAAVAGAGTLRPAVREPELTLPEGRVAQEPQKQEKEKQGKEKKAQEQERAAGHDDARSRLAARLVGMLDVEPVRAVAVEELVKLQQHAIPHLAGKLGDPDEAVVLACIGVLERMPTHAALVRPALLRALADPRWAVAGRAIQVLQAQLRAGAPKARSLPELLRLCADPQYEVAAMAALELAPLADEQPEALDALLGLSADERVPLARVGIHGLAGVRSEPERVATVLIGRLTAKDLSIVSAAAAALKTLPQTARALVMPALVARLDDRRAGVRIVALGALTDLGRPSAAAARRKAEELAKSADAGVAAAAREYLARTGARIIVADYSDSKIVEFDDQGREVFAIDKRFGVFDVECLDNGNLLVTEFSMNRVSEITRKNETVWQFDQLKNPYDADRLPNGNTLIADTFGKQVIEVDREGEIVWSYDKDIKPYDVERLANGNTLIADGEGGRAIEIDPAGKIVWELKDFPQLFDADRLPNGNTLLTSRMRNLVREVDPAGKTVFELKNLSSPSDADRLPDGNTMVAENGQVRKFDKDGRQIWRVKTTWAVEANLAQ